MGQHADQMTGLAYYLRGALLSLEWLGRRVLKGRRPTSPPSNGSIRRPPPLPIGPGPCSRLGQTLLRGTRIAASAKRPARAVIFPILAGSLTDPRSRQQINKIKTINIVVK